MLFREIAPRCLSERSLCVGWVGTPPTHGLCPSADLWLCCSFFPILFSTSFHNCPSSSADGLSAALSPNTDFDLSQGKKKTTKKKKVGCELHIYAPWTETLPAWKSNREGTKTWWFWDQISSDSLRSPEVRKSLSAACFCVSALFSAQVRIFCHHFWLLFAFPGERSIWECLTELKILQSWGSEYYYNVKQPWKCSSFFPRTAPNLLTICPGCSQQSSARPQVFPPEIRRVLKKSSALCG